MQYLCSRKSYSKTQKSHGKSSRQQCSAADLFTHAQAFIHLNKHAYPQHAPLLKATYVSMATKRIGSLLRVFPVRHRKVGWREIEYPTEHGSR